MFLGFGMRSFWKKIPGELFILIGFAGIIATLSYGKFYTINVVKNPYFLLFLGFSILLIVSILLHSHQSGIKENNDLSSWIYFNRLMEIWKLNRIELHEKILNTELRGKRHVDYTDYASSQETSYIIPVKKIDTEFDIIDDKLCFRRKDIEEFEKKYRKINPT